MPLNGRLRHARCHRHNVRDGDPNRFPSILRNRLIYRTSYCHAGVGVGARLDGSVCLSAGVGVGRGLGAIMKMADGNTVMRRKTSGRHSPEKKTVDAAARRTSRDVISSLP